ncbi:MAG: TetR/AcrR family transcriptional regulator [Brevundimonas sp.]|nr:MAG: TetR/AcrR family transcriptional regulator [Brevundimonas sp.]
MSESHTLAAEPVRMNRRQAAKVRTREKVLEAASQLFAERGYDAATIRDIAKAAGMSTGAVFANFQDKAELFEAVFTDRLSRSLEQFQAGAASKGSVRDRLVASLSGGYHAMIDQLPLIQAVIARSWFQPSEADQRTRAAVGAQIDVLANVLRDGVGSGELGQDTDVPLISRLVWELYLSNVRYAAYDGWDVKALTEHAGKQIDVLLAGSLAR